jgi:molybdenum cofactor cytidylyltransferase
MISCSLPTLRIVVLAAGFSARLGEPKALARVRGVTLLDRTLNLLAPFAADSKVVVVVPPRAGRYRVGVDPKSVAFVANRRRAAGLSSSVRYGIARARYSAAVLLLPVDLVRLDRRDIGRLISRWRGSRRKVVARRTNDGAATPLILPRGLYSRARLVTGNLGLRNWVRGLPSELVSQVDLSSAAADVDTVEDLARARRHLVLPQY